MENAPNKQTNCINRDKLKEYYHLPGYGGKIPQETQMFGFTRSEISRHVFQNPYINTQPDTLFSPDINENNSSMLGIRSNSLIKDQLYSSDMTTSGYTGHIPTIQEKFGRNRKHLFLQSIDDFENEQMFERSKTIDFYLQELLHNGSIHKQDLTKDSLLHYTREQMPLKSIERYAKPYRRKEKIWQLNIYKMSNDNEEKRFISGYQGHCPRLLNYFGKTYTLLTHDALNDFTDTYQYPVSNM